MESVMSGGHTHPITPYDSDTPLDSYDSTMSERCMLSQMCAAVEVAYGSATFKSTRLSPPESDSTKASVVHTYLSLSKTPLILCVLFLTTLSIFSHFF